MDPTTTPDIMDPAIVALTVLLTAAIKRWAPEAVMARLKPFIPGIAFLLALAMRVGYDAYMLDGGQLSWTTLVHAFGAATAAVWGHTQFRSLVKALAEPPPPQEEPGGES